MNNQFQNRPALKSGNYKIADLANRYDTSLRTLRYYEQSGLVRPHRPNQHTRFYSEEDVSRLDLVFDCRRTGMSVREIRDLLRQRDELADRDFSKAYARALRKRMAQLLEELEELERQKTFLKRDLAALDASDAA
ncbi:MerR family transcriptional regulator [Roseibium aggregatum]|uniref:MerR family transcriptional regulator n=1 Tax=Roseibium aggregatum TaxID=187304 RepID=A0A926S583_9HYPH|nr:MerR family transcriptional regulator [Roseibium aggregatum]MBD1545167.1 MerR family transcriptional regulator [Roseibium aggregatum]